VECLQTRVRNDEPTMYLVLRAVARALTILVPRESLDLVGVRPPITSREAIGVLATLAAPAAPVPPCNTREGRDLFRKVECGDPIVVAEVLRDLIGKENEKRLSASERGLVLRATEILASELAVALSTSCEQATARIAEALTQGAT